MGLAGVDALQRRALAAFSFLVLCAVAYGIAVLVDGRETRRSRRVGVLLCLGIAAVGASFYFPFTNDDAFIFFRYARNLIDGYGLVYNPGQAVEGFTSPFWTLLLAAAGAMGIDVPWAAKLLGILLTLGAVWGVWDASTRIGGSVVGFASALIFASSQLLLAWAGSGMDVALFVCFESWLLVLFLRDVSWPYALAFTAFGVLVRPEAYLFLGMFWIWKLLRAPRRRGMAFAAAAAALLGCMPFVLRWFYYGDLLPNTYYAKSFMQLRWGVDYVLGAARYYSWPVVGLAALGMALDARARPWLPVGCMLLALYLIAVGGDILSLRLGLFALPWLVLGLAALFRRTAAYVPYAAGAALALAGGCALLSAREMQQGIGERDSQVGPLYVVNNGRGTLEVDYLVGQYLARNAQPGDWLMTDNIGAVGYESKLPIFDTYGLVDRRVAALVAQGRGERVRDLARAADAPWILCYESPPAAGPQRWGLWGAGDITEWARDRYDPVQRWESATGYRRLLLHRRPAAVPRE